MAKFYLWKIPVVASSGHGWVDSYPVYEINNFHSEDSYSEFLLEKFYNNTRYVPHDEDMLEMYLDDHEIYNGEEECRHNDGYTKIRKLLGAAILIGVVPVEFSRVWKKNIKF